MNTWKNEEEINACLTACGCTQEDIQQYLVVVKHGTKADQLCWLKRQRRIMMEQLHEMQSHVDWMDYLIRNLES